MKALKKEPGSTGTHAPDHANHRYPLSILGVGGNSAASANAGFPSIFNDLKLSDRHPLFEHGRLSANIPAAFGRISNLGDDFSALRSGLRDSFFGMQSNFGKFPTFGPILPEDSLNLSPHTRRNGGAAAHKKRIQKRQQAANGNTKNSYR